MIFVDTNYFLRFSVRDVEEQYKIVEELFKKASEGKQRLVSTTLVLFEISWVLLSQYNIDKAKLVSILNGILEMSFVCFSERQMLLDAIKLYGKSSLSLEDCYYLEFCREKKITKIASFDNKLLKAFKDIEA